MQHYLVQPCPSGAPDWARADCLTDFAFPWEETPAPRTEFRALWDPEQLYFRFDCVDADLVLDTSTTLRERVIGSDRVELFLAPDLTLDPYFCLEMDPRGELLAYRCRSYRQFEWDWQCEGFTLSASIHGSGYSVSGSLPLSTLRALNVLKPEAPTFLAGLYRAEFSHLPDGTIHPGWLPWVDPHTAAPDFHVPASFGVFKLVGLAAG